MIAICSKKRNDCELDFLFDKVINDNEIICKKINNQIVKVTKLLDKKNKKKINEISNDTI